MHKNQPQMYTVNRSGFKLATFWSLSTAPNHYIIRLPFIFDQLRISLWALVILFRKRRHSLSASVRGESSNSFLFGILTTLLLLTLRQNWYGDIITPWRCTTDILRHSSTTSQKHNETAFQLVHSSSWVILKKHVKCNISQIFGRFSKRGLRKALCRHPLPSPVP